MRNRTEKFGRNKIVSTTQNGKGVGIDADAEEIPLRVGESVEELVVEAFPPQQMEYDRLLNANEEIMSLPAIIEGRQGAGNLVASAMPLRTCAFASPASQESMSPTPSHLATLAPPTPSAPVRPPPTF